MQTITRNEVEINDIFGFAKLKYGHRWNECCNIFQIGGSHEVLPFKGHKSFCLKDLEGNVNDENYKEFKQAYEILISFMKKNKLEEMYYVGDGN